MTQPVHITTISQIITDRPIVLTENTWHTTIVDLYINLRQLLKDNFLALLSTPSDDFLVFDSNVLIIVKERTPEITKKILDIVDRINEKYRYEISINPLITTPNDTLIDRFTKIASGPNRNTQQWLNAINDLKCTLIDETKTVIDIIASPSDDFLVFDSNVLIIVKERTPEITKKILDIVDRINEKYRYEISINPLITTGEDYVAHLFRRIVEKA